MPSYRRILVATEYSPSSELALETAVALATQVGAELVVLHVFEQGGLAFPFPLPEGVRDAARARLDQTVAGLRVRMLNASGVLREGAAWDQICTAAADLGADLVVVGTQGRRGLPRWVMGSVAERVVRLSPVPVLTVRSSSDVAILAGGMDRFRHILAPTDFSEASRRGVETATSLALDLGTSLTLAHVYELPSAASYLFEGLAGEAEAEVGRLLEAELARVRGRVPGVEGIVRRGDPWRGILDAAKERSADLVVMSTHGLHGLQRLLLGSVTEKIVRLSPIPVLTTGAR
jgi:nucleotide-binding universal stress UspA family protein